MRYLNMMDKYIPQAPLYLTHYLSTQLLYSKFGVINEK